MNRRWVAWIAVVAIGALRAETPRRALAWFSDGSGLEIYTESTGSTRPSRAGSIGLGPSTSPKEEHLVNRVVVDEGNTILFAYSIESSRGAERGTVAIGILPITPKTEASYLEMAGRNGWPKFSGTHLPTVAAVREFPSVRIGDAVTLDILYNPATREKIFDVLRPLAGPTPCPGNMCTTTAAADKSLPPQEISLKEIALNVNGKALRAPPATITGAAVRIDIPGHGAYVLTAYEPEAAMPAYAFKAIAGADGVTLRWSMDGDSVEIVSQSNVLTGVSVGTLWVYHDPRYRSQDQPDLVGLRNADKVEWLLPKK
jgi:hypothetical protein